LPVAHGLELGLSESTVRPVVEAPGPAILVVDGYPEMAMHRMIAARRNHGERRHDPLGNAPVVVAVVGVAAGADIETARAFDHLEEKLRGAQIVPVSLCAL